MMSHHHQKPSTTLKVFGFWMRAVKGYMAFIDPVFCEGAELFR